MVAAQQNLHGSPDLTVPVSHRHISNSSQVSYSHEDRQTD